MQISDFLSLQYKCDQTQKTTIHIIFHCSLYVKIKKKLCFFEEKLNIKILINSFKNI